MSQKNDHRSFVLHDVASGPMYLIIFGIPALLVIGIAAIVFITVRLTKKARKEALEIQNKPDHDDQPDKQDP